MHVHGKAVAKRTPVASPNRKEVERAKDVEWLINPSAGEALSSYQLGWKHLDVGGGPRSKGEQRFAGCYCNSGGGNCFCVSNTPQCPQHHHCSKGDAC